MGHGETPQQFFLQDRLHSDLGHAADADWIKRFDRMGSKIGHWPWRLVRYTHHFIFPNLTVTSLMGYSFHVQVFEPTAVGKTTIHSRTAVVEFTNSSAVGTKMLEHIHADGHGFTPRVFDEDAGICAKVQAGFECATRIAVLAEGLEDRINHFQSAYFQLHCIPTQ